MKLFGKKLCETKSAKKIVLKYYKKHAHITMKDVIQEIVTAWDKG